MTPHRSARKRVEFHRKLNGPAPRSAVFEEVAEEAAGDARDDHRVRLAMRLKPRRKIGGLADDCLVLGRMFADQVAHDDRAGARGHEGRYRFRSERRPRPRPAPVPRASPVRRHLRTHVGSRNRRAAPSHLVDCKSTAGTRAVIDYDGLVCGQRYAIEHHASHNIYYAIYYAGRLETEPPP